MTGTEQKHDSSVHATGGSSTPAHAGTDHAAGADGRNAPARWVGDLSGAWADLGTFLPLMIGAFAVQRLDPAGVLVGFGVFALAVALIYRRPVPVQPMKAVAALVIAGGLGASDVTATGLLLGIVLVLLAAGGAVGRLARVIPRPVLTGVQLGVGLYLGWSGLQLILQDLAVGALALAVLLALQRTALKPLAALAVVAGAATWGATRPDVVLPALAWELSLPSLHLPDWNSFRVAATTVVLPQLALTVTNAALVTAAIAAELFPEDRTRITPDRLAMTSGALNLLLAPLGAFPMCHGAGGLVVQHRFGARTGLAPALFGISCLALGLALGSDALTLLSVLPLSAAGALLVVAGADLALGKTLRRARGSRLAVILLTALVCVTVNVAAGLVAGIMLEMLRSFASRRRPHA